MSMSEESPLALLNSESRLDKIFPTLNPEQIARISTHGTKRRIASGDVVYEAGAEEAPFVVVIAGQLQMIRPSGTAETLITGLGPGQFTGEANMLAGHRPMVRVLATQPTEVIRRGSRHRACVLHDRCCTEYTVARRLRGP
jgi:thioredoxin reductase (NADPH)